MAYILQNKLQKLINDVSPNYLNKVFQRATECNRTLRNNYRKVKHSLCKTAAGQKIFGTLKMEKFPESTK